MYESELLDHIEKISHRDEFKGNSIEEYRKWFSENFKVEDRMIPPGQQPWLKEVHSFGIETRIRHD
jgi:hypothetical protein